MKYALSDLNGNIIAFYDDIINSEKQINEAKENGAIHISKEQWVDCINNQGKYLIQNNSLKLNSFSIEKYKDAAKQIAYEKYNKIKNKPIKFKKNYFNISSINVLSLLSFNNRKYISPNFFIKDRDNEEIYFNNLKDLNDLNNLIVDYSIECDNRLNLWIKKIETINNIEDLQKIGFEGGKDDFDKENNKEIQVNNPNTMENNG